MTRGKNFCGLFPRPHALKLGEAMETATLSVPVTWQIKNFFTLEIRINRFLLLVSQKRLKPFHRDSVTSWQ
mgnify:CR=1 FL=1